MFPNVIAPSPLYQGLFRAPTMPGVIHPQPMNPAMAAAAASNSFLVENLLRERQHQVAPGMIPAMVAPPHQSALFARGLPPGFITNRTGLHGVSGLGQPGAPSCRSVSPRSLSPSPSPPTAPSGGRQHSPDGGSTGLQSPSQRDPGHPEVSRSIVSPGSTVPADQHTHSTSSSTAVSRATPSSSPAGGGHDTPIHPPPVTAPFLKFGVNAILSSQVSPKNSKYCIFIVTKIRLRPLKINFMFYLRNFLKTKEGGRKNNTNR